MAVKSAYGAAAYEIGELFAEFIEGGPDRPALALSSQALDDVARNAIEKSLGAFGYEREPCTFATVGQLDPQALFLLVEGLDPLFVIATDRGAAELLGRAFRTEYALDSPIRVAGRSGVAFADLSSLMATPQSKQIAWKLMKSLPK